MRYELNDFEWTAIKPMLPNKPRGVRRVNDRRVLNGIFWVLRSGAPWRDLPKNYGPYTTCYNRFVRWRRAGVRDQIMDALTAAHDAAFCIEGKGRYFFRQGYSWEGNTHPPIKSAGIGHDFKPDGELTA